jgi:putative ABC transport system permease protein
MSWIRRVGNVFRRERLNRELDEELASHIEEAIEQGRSPEEARRALGGMLRHREASRDIKLVPWLESLFLDATFAWRQLVKHRAASLGAILSLALATGAVMGVFRLVDAVLLRPLPVASPERLKYVEIASRDHDGNPDLREDYSYPQFREYRAILEPDGDVLLVGYSAQQELTFGGDDQVEKFYRQYVSGNMFEVFGLQPAAGRLLAPSDDRNPGEHAVAVLSYDYWRRRFDRDAEAVGKTFRYGNRLYEIIGVAPKGFTGTEPGETVDVFVPSMMNTEALDRAGWSWFRLWIRAKPGVSEEQVRERLQAAVVRERQEQIKGWTAGTPRQRIEAYLDVRVRFLPAAAGASELQRQYREPLWILAVLAALVLLIACANVANLRTAQAIARQKELALRVSIGASRWRLIQMALVESALVALFAAMLGVLFAWYSAPLVVSMLAPPEEPVRLVLDPDWRTLAFVVAAAASITLLCGLAPAVRASAMRPLGALKGGERPLAQRRLMNSLLAAQVSFCVLVLFVAGLFISTFRRLTTQPLGFSPEHVMVVSTEATTGKPPLETWMQLADQMRQLPGVESVAVAGWPLLSGNRWTVGVQVDGRLDEMSPLALDVSPGFFDAMKIGWLGGRDLRPGDRQPRVEESGAVAGGVAIVNESFARYYFGGRVPVGRSVNVFVGKETVAPVEIVGYVRDARYRNLRDPILPTMYVPMEAKGGGALIVRSAVNAPPGAAVLRREVSRARSEFRVRNVISQLAVVRFHSIRERMLAMLSLFFAVTALVLAGMGLFSVLSYSIVRRRREIGIRLALGARSASVVRAVTAEIVAPFVAGTAMGLGAGILCERAIRSLLFGVQATDAQTLALPAAALAAIALLATLQPVAQAIQIDPAQTLRSE